MTINIGVILLVLAFGMLAFWKWRNDQDDDDDNTGSTPLYTDRIWKNNVHGKISLGW